jgi:hypothetical protein
MKKAISPLISVMLIIVITFILILVYSLWVTDIIITTTDESDVQLGDYLECQQLKFFEDSCTLNINDSTFIIDNIQIGLDNQSPLDLKNINITIFGTDNIFEKIESHGKLLGTIPKGLSNVYNTNSDYEYISGSQLSEFYTVDNITIVSQVCPERTVIIKDCFYDKEYCNNPNTPVFSKQGGLYPDYYDLNVSLSSSCPTDTNHTIYYTTDGTTPTEESTEYTEPIVISDLGETIVKAVVYAPQSNFTMGISSVSQETYYVGGSDPINGEIYYLEHLAYIDINSTTLAGDYNLMRDLDFQEDDSYYNLDNKELWTDGNGWFPIDSYRGIFNGNGQIINNLYIYRPNKMGVGLFGVGHSSGTIKNLGVTNVYVFGNREVGAILGGFGSPFISSSWGSGFVIGNRNADGRFIGFIGAPYRSVIAVGNSYIGSLSGYNYNSGRNYYLYSTGYVKGNSNVGGLVGANQLQNATFAVNSFWDMNTSGTTYSASQSEGFVKGLTTLELLSLDYEDTFVDGLGTIWDENITYERRDIVRYNNKTYICINSAGTQEEPLHSDWHEITAWDHNVWNFKENRYPILNIFEERAIYFPPPRDLNITNVEENNITIVWNKPIDGNPNSYNVYLLFIPENVTDKVDLINIQNLTTREYIYTIKSIKNGEYIFFVSAIYNEDETSYSNPAIHIIN